jgi:hypothetical protein
MEMVPLVGRNEERQQTALVKSAVTLESACHIVRRITGLPILNRASERFHSYWGKTG